MHYMTNSEDESRKIKVKFTQILEVGKCYRCKKEACISVGGCGNKQTFFSRASRER